MAVLTFKRTKQRNGYFNRGGVEHYLIRIPNGYTADGMYTIGKVAPSRSYRSVDGARYRPEGWCLQLGSDVDLTLDELNQVLGFMEGLQGGDHG